MLSSVEEFAVRMKRRTHKKVHELSCGVVVLQIPTAHIPTSLSHLSTIIQTQENDVHGGNLINTTHQWLWTPHSWPPRNLHGNNPSTKSFFAVKRHHSEPWQITRHGWLTCACQIELALILASVISQVNLIDTGILLWNLKQGIVGRIEQVGGHWNDVHR